MTILDFGLRAGVAGPYCLELLSTRERAGTILDFLILDFGFWIGVVA
jgi:hypothetical protein